MDVILRELSESEEARKQATVTRLSSLMAPYIPVATSTQSHRLALEKGPNSALDHMRHAAAEARKEAENERLAMMCTNLGSSFRSAHRCSNDLDTSVNYNRFLLRKYGLVSSRDSSNQQRRRDALVTEVRGDTPSYSSPLSAVF